MNLEPYRAEFPHIQKNIIFLNHAGISPLPNRTVAKLHEAIAWNQDLSLDSWMALKGEQEKCRASIARMLGTNPCDVALSRNTTDGINWVANGLPWEKGDRIVTINNEYPANMYPWMRLEQKGVELHLIEPVDHRVTLEQVEAALTSNTRLLTISFVAFSTGFRANLPALGALCKEKNVLLFVDLIQGMGVFPLDLKNWGVTFASGGAQKWLLGPPGAGFFYCAQENLDLLEVTMTGADCVQTILPYTDYDLTLRDDAVRFEYGTHAMLPQVGMQASLSLLLDAGMENTEACVKTSSDILVDGAKRKGYTCLSPRNDDEWSGIVILSHPTQSPETIVNQLKSKNIWAMEREGHIRLAPHFYHTEEEMKQVVDNL